MPNTKWLTAPTEEHDSYILPKKKKCKISVFMQLTVRNQKHHYLQNKINYIQTLDIQARKHKFSSSLHNPWHNIHIYFKSTEASTGGRNIYTQEYVQEPGLGTVNELSSFPSRFTSPFLDLPTIPSWIVIPAKMISPTETNTTPSTPHRCVLAAGEMTQAASTGPAQIPDARYY